MLSKHKHDLYKKVNEVYMAMRKEYGDDAAKLLILNWLVEIKDAVFIVK